MKFRVLVLIAAIVLAFTGTACSRKVVDSSTKSSVYASTSMGDIANSQDTYTIQFGYATAIVRGGVGKFEVKDHYGDVYGHGAEVRVGFDPHNTEKVTGWATLDGGITKSGNYFTAVVVLKSDQESTWCKLTRDVNPHSVGVLVSCER